MIILPVSEDSLSSFVKWLKDRVCWAIACPPRPKKSPEPSYFFTHVVNESQEDPSPLDFVTQEDIITVGVTFVVAFVVFYIIDYIGHMFFWGSPSKSTSRSNASVNRSPRRVAMNQPTDVPSLHSDGRVSENGKTGSTLAGRTGNTNGSNF